MTAWRVTALLVALAALRCVVVAEGVGSRAHLQVDGGSQWNGGCPTAEGAPASAPPFACQSALVPPTKRGAPDTPPKIGLIEPRVWSCDFESRVLARPMRFLVVLPEGVTLTAPRLPVIYFLHGRGRHERTLLENPITRARLLASPCAVVLPRGREGWYVNSPAVPADRFADYVDEVIDLATQHFPVSRDPRQRAIGGWSMGGYGAVYTACRRPGDFAAVASIIGILDFPRPPIAEVGQNYEVPSRFGTDHEIWQQFNPRRLIAKLQTTPVFVAYADKAAERQMTEAFLADAHQQGIRVERLRLSGGHSFTVVEQALPAAFTFLERSLAQPAQPR